MLTTGSHAIDAERAFTRATRARRRAALRRWLKGERAERLAVYEERGGARRGLMEIPVEAIRGTVEPSRAALFDRGFRPRPSARERWQRVWLAEHRGAVLPPISVARVRGGFAVRDGHHRVSVARARGAAVVDAIVSAGA